MLIFLGVINSTNLTDLTSEFRETSIHVQIPTFSQLVLGSQMPECVR